MDIPIDADEVNHGKHGIEFVKFFKNMFDTCFISNFSICQRPASHAHRRRQRQPGRIQQIGMSYFLEKLDIKHVPCVFLGIWLTHLWDSAWLTLSTSMRMTWRPLTYLRPFPIDFSWKIGYKTCVPCVFLRIWCTHLWDSRPGWRCRRRWAWLAGLWHIWDLSWSISLAGVLRVPYLPYFV